MHSGVQLMDFLSLSHCLQMANSGHYCLPSDLTPASCPSPTLSASHPPTSPSHHRHLTSSRGSGGGSPSHQTLIRRSSDWGSPCSISVSPIHRIRGEEGGSSSSSYSSVDTCSLPAIQLARQVSWSLWYCCRAR